MYLIFLWVITFLLKGCYILLLLWVTSTRCQIRCQNNVKTVETVNTQACEKLKRFFFVYLNGFIAPLKEPLLFGSVIFFSSSQTKDLNSESNSLNLSGKMCCFRAPYKVKSAHFLDRTIWTVCSDCSIIVSAKICIMCTFAADSIIPALQRNILHADIALQLPDSCRLRVMKRSTSVWILFFLHLWTDDRGERGAPRNLKLCNMLVKFFFRPLSFNMIVVTGCTSKEV